MVTSYTQLLGERYRGRLDENADKFIGYASEGALRMQVLIQDLLAFSRVGRKDASKSFDCNDAVKETLLALTSAIEESGAVVTHGELPTLWADRTQIVQLFQNLIGNAIKFHGKEPPTVSVQAEKVGEQWQFSVSDNGIGKDEALHAKTGLGTSIIAALAEQLDARVDFASSASGVSVSITHAAVTAAARAL